MKKKGGSFIKVWFTVFIFCVLNGTVLSNDWIQWRGPTANGISQENGWNPKALLKGPNIVWKNNVGMGHSTVAVKGNLLYTMGNNSVVTHTEITVHVYTTTIIIMTGITPDNRIVSTVAVINTMFAVGVTFVLFNQNMVHKSCKNTGTPAGPPTVVYAE